MGWLMDLLGGGFFLLMLLVIVSVPASVGDYLNWVKHGRDGHGNPGER